MATLMQVDSSDEILLSSADFPASWSHMAHPDDYVETEEPIPLEIFYHSKPHHNRTLLRASFKVGEGRFVAMSFIVDSGAPSGIYLSPAARSKLEACGRLGVDEADNEFIEIVGLGKTSVQDTVVIHQPANIIGLPLIRKLGINFGADRPALAAGVAYF
jgi:hypothetical protein